MWEDSSSHAWSEKEELANLLVSKFRIYSDLGIKDEDSSRSYDKDHVPKPCKVEKRRLHKQRQRANVDANLDSYEDL